MVRDFTEATKDKLLKEIDDINKSTWSPLTDAIGDMFTYAGKWIGLIALNDDMSNVQKYQRRVLDMTDMTKKELKQIFDDVYSVDREFKDIFAKINDNECVYNAKLLSLINAIRPNFEICSASKIKSMTSDYDKQLKDISGKINSDFEKELAWAAKKALLENTKGFISGVLKTVVDVICLPVSMTKNKVTDNAGGIFVDTWAIIDDTFAICSNLVGLVAAALGLGYGMSAITGSHEQKHFAIKYAEAYGGASGLTETLEADEKVTGDAFGSSKMKMISEKIDAASAALGLWSDAKRFLDDPSSMIDNKFGFKEKLGTLKKADMIDKYKDDYRSWQALYRKLAKDTKYIKWKNIGNAYKYLEGFWDLPDGGWEAVAEHEDETLFKSNNKWFKALGDAYDFGEDISDIIFGAA